MGTSSTPSNSASANANALVEQALSKINGIVNGATNSTIYLPPKADMEAWLKSNKVPSADIKKLVTEYAGKPLVDTATGAAPTSGPSLIESISALNPTIAEYVIEELHLNDPNLGSSLGTRATKVMPWLLGSGSVNAIDWPVIEELDSRTAQLITANNALSSGNAAANASATDTAIYSAEASADNTLSNWGLDTPEMNLLVQRLASEGMTSPNEILQNVRITNTYRNAYQGLYDYNSMTVKGPDGKPMPAHQAMTEAEYRTYSQSVQGAAQQYGNLTLNQQQIGEILKNGVTAPEFSQRMIDIGAAISNADANVKEMLQNEYGINQSDLFQYLATGTVPGKKGRVDLPQMQREIASAELNDYAQQVGLSGISQSGFNQMADMAKLAGTAGNMGLAYGVSQIKTSMETAARDEALTQSLPGQNAPTVSTDALLASQLPGYAGISQVAAQTAVARAEEAKAAPFEKGGGYAESQKGVVGLGSART
jgi:hypothetical protein